MTVFGIMRRFAGVFYSARGWVEKYPGEQKRMGTREEESCDVKMSKEKRKREGGGSQRGRAGYTSRSQITKRSIVPFHRLYRYDG